MDVGLGEREGGECVLERFEWVVKGEVGFDDCEEKGV